jgi:4a-hydroxytetrahydrobiopterin dehydratase
VPEWSETNGAIQRTVLYKDFKGAMAFVDKVADLAEAADHHPDILIRYNKVTLTLSTHDASGITEKDFNLAEQIDRAV